MRFSVAIVSALSAVSASASIMKRGAPEILSAIAAIQAPLVGLQTSAAAYPGKATFDQVDAAADAVAGKLTALIDVTTASDKVSAADSAKIAAAFSAQIPDIKKAVDLIVSKKAQVTSPAHLGHIKMELHHFQTDIRKEQGVLASKLTLDGALATQALDIFKTIDGSFTAAIAAYA